MMRTALALFFCLVVDRLHFYATQEYVPWAWYLATDTIVAAIVLARPAGRVQAAIGITFLAEISAHVAYGIFVHRNGYHYEVAMSYWRMLYGVAILQAVLIVGWTAGGLARRIPLRNPLRDRILPAATHMSGLGIPW